MVSSRHSNRSERGAIIIHVALALIALVTFTAIVIDYGVMWVSRRQAQNAADGGALAAAVSMMNDGGQESVARLVAQQFTNNAQIWGQSNSTANVRIDFSGPSEPEQIWPCAAGEHGCVRVDVFRNMPDRTSRSASILGIPLPTYFGLLAGVNAQGVRATATARLAAGNAIECMLPFAVMDRWADNYDNNVDTTYWANDGQTGTAGWTNNDDYQPTMSPADVYVPPYNGNTNHTGWKVLQDYGRQLILKFGTSTYSSGWSNRVYLPGSGGADDYREDIMYCNRTPVGIATAEEPCAPAPGGDTTGREINGCISVGTGIAQGPTTQGIDYIVNNITGGDPGASWTNSYVWPDGRIGAVVNSSGAVNMDSKRIRPLAVIDIQHYQNSGCSGGTCIAKVANIIGFFVEGMCKDVRNAGRLEPGNNCGDPNKDVVGRIVRLPGTYVSGTGTTVTDASFIEVVRLVR